MSAVLDYEELASENIGLAYARLGTWLKRLGSTNRDELESAIFEGFFQAVRKYNPDRGAFSTLAYLCMDNAVNKIPRYYNAKRRQAKVLSLDSVIKTGDERKDNFYWFIAVDEDGYNQVEAVEVIKILLEYLDKREKEIIKLRYYNELTQMEVAKVMGITQTHVSRLEKRALGKMRGILNGLD